MGVLQIEQACTNFGTICIGSLQIEQACTNSRPICIGSVSYTHLDVYKRQDIERIMSTEGMLKSRKKIEAIINNAHAFQRIQDEFGSFCEYIWAFTNHKTLIYEGHSEGRVPAKNELSTRISKDLKKRGFKFVGPVTLSLIHICDYQADWGVNAGFTHKF